MSAYRLVGAGNHLAVRDAAKGGGEADVRLSSCALYELIPAGKAVANPDAPESFVVKVTLTPPGGGASMTREATALDRGRGFAEASESFRWAAAVASFGQILRDSAYRGTATIDGVLEQAESARGSDPRGDRKAFLEMIRKAKELGAR